VVIVLACIGFWYLQATERQKARDNYNLGLAYENGQGVAKDDAQAAFFFRLAADQGNAAAQEALGAMYVNGRGGLAQDDAQAVFWFQKAADQGNADAQGLLGAMYFEGRGGLAKDDVQAVYWYRKAADQGNAAAQDNLGVMYETGRGGLAQDYAQAVSWFQKAADQGNAAAQNGLGFMYVNGRGGLAQDDVQAVYWYRKAADQGNAAAQDNLGVMYENGRGGLAKDDVQAVSWFQKAADQGNAEAIIALADVYARQQQETSPNMLFCKSSSPGTTGNTLYASMEFNGNEIVLGFFFEDAQKKVVDNQTLNEGTFIKDQSTGLWLAYFDPPNQGTLRGALFLPKGINSDLCSLKWALTTGEGDTGPLKDVFVSGPCSRNFSDWVIWGME
jgi:TPR repeat protein